MVDTALYEDFLSRDPMRIWSASCAVRNLWDRSVLSFLYEHVLAIASATRFVPLPGRRTASNALCSEGLI